ncbi:uridine monophosphate kinase [Streptomyces sp. 5K101]|uniref:uridine monophosphate kinase n=1 Tax=Streptomyces sp. 5K101 TaxID=3390037 RepID=UPI00397535D4
MVRYTRAVAKISGRAFAGPEEWGTDPDSLAHLAEEILAVHRSGTQIAAVIGGGNYARGRSAHVWGIDRAEADDLGMLGTVMNALLLRGALRAHGGPDVRVMTAIPMHPVAEPYVRQRADRHLRYERIVLLGGGIGLPYASTDHAAVQRALELGAEVLLVAKHGVDGVFDADPRTHPDAKRYSRLPYDQAINLRLAVMDATALVLAEEYGLPMHVFNATADGAMRAICQGADIGTRLTGDGPRRPEHRSGTQQDAQPH